MEDALAGISCSVEKMMLAKVSGKSGRGCNSEAGAVVSKCVAWKFLEFHISTAAGMISEGCGCTLCLRLPKVRGGKEY